MTTHKLNTEKTVAVSLTNEWLRMSTCPIGVKVHVMGPGDCATHTVWDGKDPQWKGWFPIPAKPDWMKS